MAWAPDYTDLATLKAALGIPAAHTVDDDSLGAAITAASRAIDHHCGRQFGVLEAAAPRYYTPTSHGRPAVVVDDLMSTDDLVVEVDGGGGTYATELSVGTDVDLFPWNAELDAKPWTMIVSRGAARLPCRERSVRVTAVWGWEAIPAVVVQATLLQAGRIFKRKDAPFGILGSPESGAEIRLLAALDPDVAVLLSGVRRYWGAW